MANITHTLKTLPTDLLSQLFSTTLRPGLHPIPGTKPLTFEAALCPPLLYYVSLLFLPPPPPDAVDSTVIKLLRNILAIIAGILFFRLPLAYHVPQSIGLTYQLGLIGIYGGCRVFDAFFISRYLFNHVPRRVNYDHWSRQRIAEHEQTKDDKPWSDGGMKDPFMGKESHDGTIGADPDDLTEAPQSNLGPLDPLGGKAAYKERGADPPNSPTQFLKRALKGPDPEPVIENATTEDGYPRSFIDRASWSLELELSMRGVGFSWTTSDVRHTRNTWLPSVGNRLHSIFVHVMPLTVIAWAIIRSIYVEHLADAADDSFDRDLFNERLSLPLQLLLTWALGAFLMAAFSLGHSIFAIMCHPLAPSPLAFFPPLYTTPVWGVESVRGFWSYGWHRLFARLFLVYGVWPGEWVERKLTGKKPNEPADVGKVIGAFLSSAFVHSFAGRGVLGGDWNKASGEAKFFALNGIAVVIEGTVKAIVLAHRKRKGQPKHMFYDGWIGRLWWISVLLFSGRNFARGWVRSGLVREMAFM